MSVRCTVSPRLSCVTAHSHRRTAVVAAAAFLVAGFVGSAATAQARSPIDTAGADHRFVAVAEPGDSDPQSPGPSPRYIVRLRTRQSLQAAVVAEGANGDNVDTVWNQALSGFTATLSGDDVRRLRRDPNVTSIEPDSIVTLTSEQTGAPWGLDRVDQRALPLSTTYSYETNGSGVNVYIVDSGIRSSHREFTGRIVRGMYVDFGDATGIEDCNGHGTHVAGTIGGTTFGVAKGVSLIPVKVFACSGSTTTSAVIAGLDWIISDHAADVPAVVNMSLGGQPSAALDAAVNAVIADGVTVVVAAGNASSDSCTFSPSRVAAAITVGASQVDDGVAAYSNYGPCNDLFAPGSSILSAWSTTDTASMVLSGTSMATPHIAGAVARLLQGSHLASPAQVWAALDAAATPNALTATYGGDPNKLLYLAAPRGTSVPSAPWALAGAPGDQLVALTWQAPWSDDSLPIADYAVQVRATGAPWSTFADGTSAATGATVTNLINGTTYDFRVAAINAVGIGALGAQVSITPSNISVSLSPPAAFRALPPHRVFDTRPGEAQGAVPVHQLRYGGANVLTLRVAGVGGVPVSGVGAVSLNVTVVDPVDAGFVTVYPCGQRPLASNLNYTAGQTVPNAVITPVSADGNICLYSSADAYLLADINGWFPTGTGLTPVTPARLFDTRPGEAQGVVPVDQQPYGDLQVHISGVAGVPDSGVGGVSLNVTVVDPTEAGFVTVYPCGQRPLTSNLNYTAGQTVPNAVITPVSADGNICLYSSADAYLLADINGWFATGTGLTAVTPARLFDTRPEQTQGAMTVNQQPYGDLQVHITGVAGVPMSGVAAVSLNVTVVGPSEAGFVTVYPCGQRPLTSNLNYTAGQTVPNAVLTPVSADGDICLHSSATAYLLADINGWFATGPAS